MMSPRIRCSPLWNCPSFTKRLSKRPGCFPYCQPTSLAFSQQYVSASGALSAVSALRLPEDYIPPTQPPSARPSDARKAQLLRSYTSLLRSTPLMLIFQHNNLTAIEWAAIRRELNAALAKVATPGPDSAFRASSIRLQVIRTRMFAVALKIVEFFDPSNVTPSEATTLYGTKKLVKYNHDLSKAAYQAIKKVSQLEKLPESSPYAQLAPLMIGPMALVTFPAVLPAHLAAALTVLAPSPPAFPAPTRKKSPGYYDPIAQSGFQKLMLVGGRVEGKVFDVEGVKWVGGIEAGIESLHAQIAHILQNAGLGLTSVLEGAGTSLWLTMESRRSVLEEENGGAKRGQGEEVTQPS